MTAAMAYAVPCLSLDVTYGPTSSEATVPLPAVLAPDVRIVGTSVWERLGAPQGCHLMESRA